MSGQLETKYTVLTCIVFFITKVNPWLVFQNLAIFIDNILIGLLADMKFVLLKVDM